MNGADRMEAAVAAAKPGFSPSPKKKLNPSNIPNFGMRLKQTPTNRGPTPLIDALSGCALNTALASSDATRGSTGLPSKSLAYCCTN